MAKRIFIVSPDYIPKQFLEWHRLNMVLQRDLEQPIELWMPASGEEYRKRLNDAHPDIVFANPFDAGWLMTEHGYRPLAKPAQQADEVVIFSRKDSGMSSIRDIAKNSVFAALDNPGTEMVGLRLLEAANLNKEVLRWRSSHYFQAVIRMVREQEAGAGLILAAVYDDLHPFIQRDFQVLIRSALEDISHLFLVRGDDPALYEQLSDILAKSKRQTRYYSIWREINCKHGFDIMSDEDGLFLSDVLETLKD